MVMIAVWCSRNLEPHYELHISAFQGLPRIPEKTNFALFSCHTEIVPKNITIKLADETALWARRKAAEENTSVSKLVSQMLEREMRLNDDYWRAYERWKSRRVIGGTGAAQRMSREEVHERR